MNSIKSKKILVLILDAFLGLLIGFLSSKTFPSLIPIFIVVFIILLILRIGIDWFALTDEEKYYKDFVRTKLDEMQRKEEVQQTIHNKLVTALADGNIGEYKEYSKIKKDLK